MVIGLYGPDIIVSNLPSGILLPFTAAIVVEGEGRFRLSGNLKRSGSDENVLTFGAKIEVKKSGAGYVPFKFPLVNLKEAGTYAVSLTVVG